MNGPIREHLHAYALKARSAVLRGKLSRLSLAAAAAMLLVSASGGSDRGSMLAPGGKAPSRPMSVMTGPVTVYGPTQFQGPGGSGWALYSDAFTADSTDGWRYTLELTNNMGATGAQVSVNNRQFVGTSEFGSTTSCLTRVIDVKGPGGTSNALDIWVKGSASSSITVKVTRAREPAFTDSLRFWFVSNSANWTDSASVPIWPSAGTPHTLWAQNGDSSGTGHRVSNATVKLNGTQVMSSSDFGTGRATANKTVSLNANTPNIIKVNNLSGSGTRLRLWLTSTDTTAPLLTTSLPALDTTYTESDTVLFVGQVRDELHGIVTLGPVAAATPDTFSLPLVMTQDDRYNASLVATNSGNLTSSLARVVYRDRQAPAETLSTPAADTTLGGVSAWTVVGRWSDVTPTVVTVNGDTAAIGFSGRFSKSVALDPGPNRIYVTATDRLGHATTITRLVYLNAGQAVADSSARAATLVSATEVSNFRDQIGFLFRGTPGHAPVQAGASLDTAKIVDGNESVIHGVVAARDFGVLGGVNVSVLGHGEFGYTKTLSDGAFDLAVNAGGPYVLRFTLPGFLESQRQVVAPPLDYAIVDTVALIGRSTTWYYADTTASRTITGRFDSDLNGGRRIWVMVPNGALATVTKPDCSSFTLNKYRIRLKEYTVGSGGPNTMPAQLPPTTAYTYCVDMSLVEADSATGTIGADVLPSTATFSKPLVTYVREFLNLPVGAIIPAGYYDTGAGVWVPEENGKVIKVLSASGGQATLDTDGDTQADAPEQYATLGVDSLERVQIAQNFRAGDVLWRNRVNHFSGHDFNQNYTPSGSSGATTSAEAGPGIPNIGDPEKTCGCVIENENRVLGETIPIKGTPFSLSYRSSRQYGDKAGRWIRIPLTGQTLPPNLIRVRVIVDVAGRRFKKVYPVSRPNEVAMFTDWDGIDVYGRRVPGSVTATVRMAYEYQQSYAIRTNSSGRDFGNSSSVGSMPGTNATGDRDLGQFDWTTQKVSVGAPSMASAGLGGWTIGPHDFYDRSGRGALYYGDGSVRYGFEQNLIIKTFAGTGDAPDHMPANEDKRSLGVSASELAFGPDGSLYYAGGPNMVFRIKPDGKIIPWAGCENCDRSDPFNFPRDGEPALSTQHRLAKVTGLAVAPDGSLYISDEGWKHVYRVTMDGTIHVVAGKDSAGYGGFADGAVAKGHALSVPTAVAVGPDGSVYIGDSGYKRVVRIGADGLMRSFAGDSCCGSATSGKADSIDIPNSGAISDLATDRAGNVYIATGSQLLQVTPAGRMELLNAPDHGINKLATGPAGELIIGTPMGYSGVVRRDRDGSLSTLSGTYLDIPSAGACPIYTPFSAEEGGFAKAARNTGVGDVAVGLDGKVYVSQIGNNGSSCNGAHSFGIRTIESPVPGVSSGELAYPSEDGRSVDYFTLTGRHKRTVDAKTGVTLYSFDYDGGGRLIRIRDANGDSTSIERDGSGAPTEIVAPRGQRTNLTLTGGYLSRVSDPLTSEAYAMSYSADGLLEHFTNPRTQSQTFTYNAGDGRLSEDTDAALAKQTLTYADSGVTQFVSRKTQENRVTKYQVTRMLDGLRRRLITYPNHAVLYRADEMSTESTPYREVIREIGPSGEITLTYPQRDQRYGMLAKIPASVTTILPSGTTRRTATTRDTLTADVLTETYAINDNVFTSRYAASTRVQTMSTPEGRTSSVTLDAAGRPVSVSTGSSLDPVSLHYDSHGRLDVLSQGGRAWHYDYDALGRLDHVRDPRDSTVTYGYNNADRVTSQSLPGGRGVSYGYDANGNLDTLTVPGGKLHRFSYTAVDLNDSYTPPSVGGLADNPTQYEYDRDRLLTRVTRPDGNLLLARYDAYTGLLDSLTQARGKITFSYLGTGQLASVTSPDGIALSYGYDGPVLRSESWGGLRGAGSVDSVSALVNMAFADSVETVNGVVPATYTYDRDGLLSGVSINGTTEMITHRGGDGLLSNTSVGGVTSEVSYDNHGEPWKLHYAWTGGSFEQVLTRDSLGRIVSIAESGFGNHSYDYHYDAAGRLDSVAVDGVKRAGYTYDANGNRMAWRGPTSADTASAKYDDQDRMLRYGSRVYAYTAAGELVRRTSGPTDTLRTTYDVLGNLTGARAPSGDTLRYLVDGANRRVTRTRNGHERTSWLYAGGIFIAAEMDSTGAVRNRYVYGSRGHVPDLVVQGGVTYRLITDQLGSVRAAVNVNTGVVAQRIDYDAWGVITYDSAATFQSLGYAGGLEDRATGLVRFGARDYEPGVGRWTCKDPVVLDASSPNLFVYSYDDPLDESDPNGLCPNPQVVCKPCSNCVGNCIKESGGNWAAGALGLSAPFVSIPWLGRSKTVLGSTNPLTSVASIALRAVGQRAIARGAARALNPAANVIFVGALAYSAELWWVCVNMCKVDPSSW